MTWLADNRTRLRCFREGDPEVLEQTYRHYAPALAKSLATGFSLNSRGERLRFGGITSPFELDDAVQETFVRAFSEKARLVYDGTRPYGGYLFSIARNFLVDEHRSKHGGAEVSPQIPPQQKVDSTPESSLADAQLLALYKDFVASLADESRELWVLRVEKGHSRRDLERLLGLSAMQLRTREQKLRVLLFKRVSNAGYSFRPPNSPTLLVIVVVL